MPKFKQLVKMPGPPKVDIEQIRRELEGGKFSYWKSAAGMLIEEIDRMKIIMRESSSALTDTIRKSDELIEDHKATARMWHDKYMELLQKYEG
ncbi:hypothetical protein G7L40_00925 [Paenibacillus polymyxa]|uniref:Uncharacterized protein n=1 Tax=Paenibacillus polymyxa TaxID=1406 RepID=A0A378XUH9_PAEPO|nr:hypothetical protein [Paenibacillus polymyxa]MBE7897274.1 hypothetical protein [Paenibacillus polymyxa]MBG9763118.1 hypothetical protein [Paenibacillus polymyxa]MBG9766428.1 hypothetical protein [Paenibacillus polymyxa]MCC3257478.1 hypothetical protein [Paenibacillus polymyxa]QPK51422.1 hypothetical protein G7035_00920 [Paenibacillus polymyxa]